MDIEIKSKKVEPTGTYYELGCDGKDMFIGVCKGFVTTLVYNAAHQAYRGAGKVFHGETAFEDALAHYKSPACKAMIEHARAGI